MCGRRPTTATSTTSSAPTRPSETAQIRGVTSTRGAVSSRSTARRATSFRVLTRLATVATASVPRMTSERDPDRDLGRPRHGLAAVDERQLVDVQRVQDELDADEPEDHREALRQVHEALQQAADEEVQLAQAEQRERVRGEHDVRLVGQAVDRRDRVEREQEVGRPDRDHHHEHRREHALAVDPDAQPVAVVLLGGRQHALEHADGEAVRLRPSGSCSASCFSRGQLDGRVHQERAEEVEHPGELLDRRGAEPG